MRLSSVFVLSCLLFSGVLASPKPMTRRHGELFRSAGHKTRRVNRVVTHVTPPEPPASVISSAPVRRRFGKRCLARNSTMSSSSSASTSSSTPSSAPAPVNVAPAPSIQSSASEKEPSTTAKKPSASPKPPPPPPTHSASPPPPPPPPPKPSPPPPPKPSSPPPPPPPPPPPSSGSPLSVASIVANGVIDAADLTFFTPGLGACGISNTDSDLIAAVGHDLFDGFPGATGDPNDNPVCNKKIRITYQGKSLVVTATDRCTGCNAASLDLTPNAFQHFSSMSAGRLHGASWDWCTDC